MTLIGNTEILAITPTRAPLAAPLCPACGDTVDACRCGFVEETVANAARRESTES